MITIKRLGIAVIFMVLFNIHEAKAQWPYLDYPSYEMVLQHFFTKYSTQQLPDTIGLAFEKRPDGWHVAQLNTYHSMERIRDELIWSRDSLKFFPVNYSFFQQEDANPNFTRMNSFLTSYEKYSYWVCPYYGYTGWDEDVINDYEKIKDLPDSLFYALGRAYSSYASNLLNNNSGFSQSSHRFKLREGLNALSPDQLKEYRKYRHKAIDLFAKVNQINPLFETFVGSIGVKLANEYLCSYLDLRMYQNEDEARKELKPGLYPDFYISLAKNFLSSCEFNSILFTYGDNDTYPLLYAQEILNYRPDVIVVNVSLLSTSRYINCLSKSNYGENGIPLHFTSEQLADGKREIIIITKENQSYQDLETILEMLRNDANVKEFGTGFYPYISGGKFRLKTDHQQDLMWEITEDYLYKSSLVMLDIIAANEWKRPINFSFWASESAFMGLQDYLNLQGMVYRLIPENCTLGKDRSRETSCVNRTELFNNLLKKFEWKDVQGVSSHERLLCSSLRMLFGRLASSLIQHDEKIKAKQVLDFCVKTIPDFDVFEDQYSLSLVECYYKMGDFREGNALGVKIAVNVRNGNTNNKGLRFIERSDNQEAILGELKRLAMEYHQDILLNKL